MNLAPAEARFEIEHRIKAFFFFLSWVSWGKTDYDLNRATWNWISFWHTEATCQRDALQGYEWQKFKEWKEAEEGREVTG